MEISSFFYLLGFLSLVFCAVDLIHIYYTEKQFKNNQEHFQKKLKSEKSNQDFDDKLKPM